MSSKYVRDTFLDWLETTFTTENVADLTGEFGSIQQILDDNVIPDGEGFLGVQFLPEVEESASVNGCFREYGALFLHLSEPVRNDNYKDRIINRYEAMKSYLRNASIGRIRVQSIVPPNFEAGATLNFERGFQSASVIVRFYCDDNT